MKPSFNTTKSIILIVLATLLIGCSSHLTTKKNVSEISEKEKHYIIEKLRVNDVKSKYIINSKVGKLFVIRGNVINELNYVLENISVRVKLFTTPGNQIDERIGVCGNSMSDYELENLGIDIINERTTIFKKDNTQYMFVIIKIHKKTV